VILRVGRKPAPLHTLVLLEQLEDTPQAGETDDPENSGQNDIGDSRRNPEKNKTGNKENRPNAVREVILALDYNRMKKPDA
jgi:hypothetical protein